MYTKRDFRLSVLSGAITGIIAWKVLKFLGVGGEQFPLHWLVLVIPILWIIGVRAGFFLGRWFTFLPQFGKFAAIGLTNFVVDLGVLNILISKTGYAEGLWYALFKAAAFMVAVTHSFFWNKYWTFDAAKSHGGGQEFGRFMGVNIVAAVVNVGVATFVATKLNPVLNLTPTAWANAAAVAGSACALIFSFVGLRLLVFKKLDPSS